MPGVCRRADRLVVIIVLLATLLSGCVTEDLEGNGQAPLSQEDDKIVLQEGWSHEGESDRFWYEDGRLKGEYEGDQVVLRFKNDKPANLGKMPLTLKGQMDVEKDRSYTYSVAIWNESKPWPRDLEVGSFIREYVSVSTTLTGHTIGTGIDPNVGHMIPHSSPGHYMYKMEFRNDVLLGPGEWRIWFAIPNSLWMQVEFEIPEGHKLSAPPLTSRGCDVVEPSELEADFMVQVMIAAMVVQNLRWEIDVPPEAMLLGTYFAGVSYIGVGHSRIEFNLPNETYEFQRSGYTQLADPPDWDGTTITSTAAGPHVYRVIEERSVVGGTPKLVYCIA